MRILIYGMSELHGGVESFIYNYASNFSNEIQVDYVSDYKTIPFQNEFIDAGSKVFSLPSRKKQYLKYKHTLNSIFEQNKYDVVWANVCSLSSIDVLSVAKKHNVSKRIVHSHNSLNMSGLTTNILHNINKKRISKIATDFWACSSHAGEWMFPSSITEFKVINNAIDTKDFKIDKMTRNKLREELGLGDSFVVGHVGRYHYQKNHEFLLEIFNDLLKLKPNSKLVLVGSGELESSVRLKIKELGIEDRVLILGQRSDIPNLLQSFDVFLLPSRFEGLPFVLVEAQATGLISYTSKDVVSSQSKISEMLYFIDLKENSRSWAEQIVETHKPRTNTTDDIIKAGFDIKTEAQKVESYFLEGQDHE